MRKKMTLEEQRAELAQQQKQYEELKKKQNKDWENLLANLESRAITNREPGEITNRYLKDLKKQRKIRGDTPLFNQSQLIEPEVNEPPVFEPQEFQLNYPNRIDTFFANTVTNEPNIASLSKSSQAKVLAGTHKIVTKNGKHSIKKIGIREQQRKNKLRCGLWAVDQHGKLRKRNKNELELIVKDYCAHHQGLPQWSNPNVTNYRRK